MNKIKSNSQPVIFQESKIRRHWDGENELWYFSIIDIIKILTDSNTPKRYWSDLKNKLKNEGSEVYEEIVQLKPLQNVTDQKIPRLGDFLW